MPDGKVLTVKQLAVTCAGLRAAGKTIAHCHGAFDLLHPGHIRHVQAARKLADVLVVTVTEDRFIRKGPGRPVFNERLRAETLAALQAVDYVATSPWPTAVETIDLVKPDLYIKGQDYKDADQDATGAIVEEQQAVLRHGGQLVFTDEIQFSSTRLLNNHFDVLSPEQKAYLTAFQQHHTATDVGDWLNRLQRARVLVVGEGILDEYHYCTPDAMSNKTPTLSARFESAEVFAGGVWAVGNHLSGLAGDVKLLCCVGGDSSNALSSSVPISPKITSHNIMRPDGPTVRKRRYVHRLQNTKLFEITFLDDTPIDQETEARFLAAIDTHAPQADAVIVVDFGHGFLTHNVVTRLRQKSRFLAVNAQINSSNRGFNSIRKYHGADYISVDEHEIRLPFGDRYGPLEKLVEHLRDETQCDKVNVTLGDQGTLYYDGCEFHRAPALTSGTVDAIGAGDALLSVTALLVHAGAPAAVVPFVGNCMGGLMAQIIGHRQPVSPVNLHRFVQTLLK